MLKTMAAVIQNIKNRITTWSNKPTAQYISKEWNRISKRYVYTPVHSSQAVRTTQTFNSRGVFERNVAYMMDSFPALRMENSGTCHNMDDSWGPYAKQTHLITNRFCSHYVYKTVNSIETENKMIFSGAGKSICGVVCEQSFSFARGKVS